MQMEIEVDADDAELPLFSTLPHIYGSISTMLLSFNIFFLQQRVQRQGRRNGPRLDDVWRRLEAICTNNRL